MPSLAKAINSKYHSDNFVYNGPEDGSFVIFAPKKIPLLKGATPQTLVLNECMIDTAGDLGELENVCAKVAELDLSHNDLKSWEEVLKIMKNFNSLKFLNLSYNKNLSQEIDNNLCLDFASNLETLVLIGTEIKWNSISSLLSVLTSLKELHLSLNQIRCLTKEEEFCNIEKLTFDGNLMSDWGEVAKLGKTFPSLKQLSLSNCPLRLQVFNSDDVGGKCVEDTFQNLEVLNLSSTLLETEDELLRLNNFPKLRELRISGIPFLERVEEKQRRQELIALLPKIRVLNGGAEIMQDERESAERFFIRKFLDVEEKPLRYFELTEKHGQLLPLADINFKPVTKVTLKIKFGSETVNQKINLRQSVKELKKFLEPTVGLPASRMDLYFLDLGLGGRNILRHPNKQLYTYNMHDGDEIYVEIKNNCSMQISQR
ncbi:tubulin-specific chaperone cofactor E-like protein [Folsomia candida]|uniref:Tubulin-specific chaperone cofactor E-like protein n=1 Tax=Folsomia candida TaxID=158441 RepID=A0A226ECN5_FOLCA|nr:tubulin-specific chaperone cofactor E-like protein [Folsomia candida]OXA55210.1 Tubulin-specific chaperone cofactor E-like protein [Folsomia candida]